MALSFRRDPVEAPPEALVFAEGFHLFDGLAESLDIEFGPEQWAEVPNTETSEALAAVQGETPFALVAIGSDDLGLIETSVEVIRQCRGAGLSVLLVVGEISPMTMHRLMREGVSEFAPFPEPRGALPEAVNRMRLVRAGSALPALQFGGDGPARIGKVFATYGVAGGVGTSTFAVNLAWELANQVRKQGRRVALLDFNFQYGAVATYLDVPRREAVYELVSDATTLDQTGLIQALSTYQERLHVLTAPRDALPLDIVTPADIQAIVTLARESFDYVLIDMPQALMNWSEVVYGASDAFYALMETDMRSAQNMFRFLRTLKAEDMSLDRIRFVLNRAPGMTDLSGKTRVKRVAESLGLTFTHMLPDGGKQVVNACDQGMPLAEMAKSNPFRREVVRIAQRLVAGEGDERAASN